MSTVAGVRRLLLDEAPGERRGVVLLDGRPERLLIERDGEAPAAPLGARFVGRVTALAADRAFVALPDGPDGVMRMSEPAPARAPPAEGTAVEVEVVAEAHAEKGPRLLWRRAATGPPRRLSEGPVLADRLAAFAPGESIAGGAEAEEAADLAQEAALALAHRFRGGLTLHVEPTRALTAVDVDLAEGTAGAGERRTREANLSAVRHAVRLVRLKGLGGLTVVDLAGLPPAGDRGLLRAEAERALAADGPDASAAGPDRFGLLVLARPRRERPLAAVLLGPDGEPSPRTVAQALVRALRRQAAADPGSRWVAAAPRPVAVALAPLLTKLGLSVGLRELAAGGGEAHIHPA